MIYKYPYTDFNEYNLDWLIKTVKKIENQVGDIDQKIIDEVDRIFNEDTIQSMLESYTEPFLSFPVEYVTFENIQTLTAAEAYAFFDEYVTKGILSRTLIGYGTGAGGVTDTDHPIYRYSYKTPYYTAQTETILMTGSVHGNEKIGTSIILTLLKDFENGKNDKVNEIFSEFNIDFVPIVNPTGYDASIGNTMINVEDGIGRTNDNGVNINRNGVTCWGAESTESGTVNYKGSSSLSENETQVIETLFPGMNYYIDIHSERYNMANGDFAGRLICNSSYVRKAFLSVYNAMVNKLNDTYGLSDPLYTLTVAGGFAAPHLNIDFSNMKNSFTNGMLYEAPRYLNNDTFVESERCQKLSYDIFSNMLYYVLPLCKRETSERVKMLQSLNNLYPLNRVKLNPKEWEYVVTAVSSGPDATTSSKNTVRQRVYFPVGKYASWHFGGDDSGNYECRFFAYNADDSVAVNQNWHSSDWTTSTPIGSNYAKMYVELRKTDQSNLNILNIGLDYSPTVYFDN